VSGTDTRYTLTASTSRRPSWQEGTTLNWFQATTDTLAVRIPLVNPTKEVASVGGYKCPCPACPQCSASTCQSSTVAACCTDPSCADQDLRWVNGECFTCNSAGIPLCNTSGRSPGCQRHHHPYCVYSLLSVRHNKHIQVSARTLPDQSSCLYSLAPGPVQAVGGKTTMPVTQLTSTSLHALIQKHLPDFFTALPNLFKVSRPANMGA
jgi:hypothetical protein